MDPVSDPSTVQAELRAAERSTLSRVLTQSGMLLASAGVIALFCQVLDVSARATAIASFAAFLLASICVYRRIINRYVPSALVMALLIALGMVFFFNYKNILLKDTGLIKWFRHSNDFLAQIEPEINNAQQEIWFFGTDFNITAGERRDQLLRKLSSGVNVRFLIFNPRSSHMAELARDFSQTPGELQAECDKGLDSLIELQQEWLARSKSVQSPGELQIRVFEVHPHARFYVFDPKRSDGRTMFIPYVNDVNSTNAPGYLIENAETGIFKPYFAAVQKLWSESATLQQFPDNAAPAH